MKSVMPRSFTFVTTCSHAGWVEYAETMVESFDRNFPPEVKLVVYIDFKAPPDRDRVEFRQLSQTGMKLENYHFDLSDFDFALGSVVPYSEHNFSHTYDIIWNARKFSFKVFTICHAIRHCDTDVVVWLDADSKIVAETDYDVIARSIPEYAMVSYLGRSWRYTECGYIGYNMRHPLTACFAETVVQMYTSGAVFSLKEWHDSYVFDVVRLYFERHLNVINFNIAANVDDLDHVFLNTELGLYIDHMKGPRKSEGKSRSTDRVATYETTGAGPEPVRADDGNRDGAGDAPENNPISEDRSIDLLINGNDVAVTLQDSTQNADLLVTLDGRIIGARTVSPATNTNATVCLSSLPARVYDDSEHEISIADKQTRELLRTVQFTKPASLVSAGKRQKNIREPYIYPETELRAVADLFNCSVFQHMAGDEFMDRPGSLDHLQYASRISRDCVTVGLLLFCSAITELWHSPALKQFARADDLDVEIIVVMQSREACQFAKGRLRGSVLGCNVQIVAVEQIQTHLREQCHLDAIVTVPTGTALADEAIDTLVAVARGTHPGFTSTVADIYRLSEEEADVAYGRATHEWLTAQDVVSAYRPNDFLERTRIRHEVAEGVRRGLLEVRTAPEQPRLAVRLGRNPGLDDQVLPATHEVIVHVNSDDAASTRRFEALLSTTLRNFVSLTVVGPIAANSRIRQLCLDHHVDIIPARPFERRISPFEMMALCSSSQSLLAIELGDDPDIYAPLETLLRRSEPSMASTSTIWRSRVAFDQLSAGDAGAVSRALKRPESGALIVHRSATR
ncbi:MAG: hypothetical protein PGN34_21165 [Methylobacterium frigidaeris]